MGDNGCDIVYYLKTWKQNKRSHRTVTNISKSWQQLLACLYYNLQVKLEEVHSMLEAWNLHKSNEYVRTPHHVEAKQPFISA